MKLISMIIVFLLLVVISLVAGEKETLATKERAVSECGTANVYFLPDSLCVQEKIDLEKSRSQIDTTTNNFHLTTDQQEWLKKKLDIIKKMNIQRQISRQLRFVLELEDNLPKRQDLQVDLQTCQNKLDSLQQQRNELDAKKPAISVAGE